MTSTTSRQDVRSGDAVVLAARHVGDHGRKGEILEVLGDDLHPHYLVRWEDGRESILYADEAMTIDRSVSPAAAIAD